MNIRMDMGEVLTKAWKIVWKFKVLWIFGILAGCASNNGGSFNNNSFNNGFGGGGNGGSGQTPNPFRQFENMRPEELINSLISKYSQYLVIAGVVILLLCVLSLLLYGLGIMGRIGLVKGAGKADGGAESLTFGELWTESLPYFWRLVGLSLLVALPFFIVGIILVVLLLVGIFGVVSAGGSSSGSSVAGLFAALGIFVPAICCLSILRIVVGMIVEQAQKAIIIEDEGVLAGLRRGWDVFKTNFLTIILMAIILGVLGGIVGFIIAIPILLIVLPAVAGMVFLSASSSGAASSAAAMGPLVIAGLCCLAYFPVLLVAGGIEHAYIQSVWTLTYLRLTRPVTAPPAAPPPAVETADAQ